VSEYLAMPTWKLKGVVEGTCFEDFDQFKFVMDKLEIRLGQIYKAQKLGKAKDPKRSMKIEFVHKRHSDHLEVCDLYIMPFQENRRAGVHFKDEWFIVRNGTFKGFGNPQKPVSWQDAESFFAET
jgi:hypothetical protein